MTSSYADHLDIIHPDESITDIVGQRAVRSLTDTLPDDRSAEILEIGPGHCGFLRALLAERYNSVHGIEADEVLARRAQSNALPVFHVPVEDTIGFLLARPEQYAFVYCSHVLEHVEVVRQIEFVSAIRSALAPGGAFACEVPNAAGAIASYHRYVDWTHKCVFTPTSLRFVLASAGLVAIVIRAAPGAFVPPGASILRWPMVAVLAAMNALSEATARFHLVAELGRAGMGVPVSQAIVACARRPNEQTA